MIKVDIKAGSIETHVSLPYPPMYANANIGQGPTLDELTAFENSIAQAVGLALAGIQHQLTGARERARLEAQHPRAVLA